MKDRENYIEFRPRLLGEPVDLVDKIDWLTNFRIRLLVEPAVERQVEL